MQNSSRSVRKGYILFIVSVALTIIGQQAIVQYDLGLQNTDAQVINVSGRQRMLSQRISKLALFLNYNIDQHRPSNIYSLDSLRKLTNEWEAMHNHLMESNRKERGSHTIDSLFKVNTPHLNNIAAAAREILQDPQPEVIKQSIDRIALSEIPFLMTMEKIVHTYQREAEEKLEAIKNVELLLGAIALLILCAEYIFIIHPVLRDLHLNNQKLQITNSELVATEEEIRNNLEQISILQKDLEIKQEQYLGLIDDASDMIYELNEEGKFSFVNPILESNTGYTKKELLGMPYWELIHPDEKKEVLRFYEQQRKNLQSTSYLEFRMQTKSKESIWIGQNVKMFFNERWTYKVSVVARDIHKIKETELALSQERILLRTIIDNVPINIYAKNLQLEKILANKAEYEFVGARSEREVVGKTDEQFYRHNSSSQTKEEDKKVLAGKSILNVEQQLHRRSGEPTWFLISKVPLRNAQGEIIGLVGISNDITEEKAAREELARKEKLYRLLSENSQDVISLHKLDGTFEYVSPASIHLHGYKPEELVGKNGLEFMHPDDAKAQIEKSSSLLDKMKKRQTIEPLQFRITTKHRGLVWAENVVKPVFENDELVGFQSTVRDISARKAFEAALNEAKLKAEEATSVKSQFLSMMSHEIRTPINGIIGLTHHLLEEHPRQDQLESLNLIKFSGENLMTIINDILDLGKIEANKIVFENFNFSLREELSNIVRLIQRRVQGKPVSVALKYDQNLPDWIKSDSVRIGQMITNLMGNSVKFTEKGTITLQVDLVKKTDHNVRIKFQVHDTGIGISADKLGAIFESFSQASDDTTRKFGGTGLGLTITKQLVELMGGKIKVKSEPGKGSTFEFDLTVEEGVPAEAVEDVTSQNIIPEDFTVLLVEDDKVNQLVASNFLKKWGLNVVIANNGAEAIELLKEKKYQLVFMDLNMPVMNGYEASKKIRELKDSYYQQLPIIALTADAVGDVKEKISGFGMNGILNKPFRPTELRKIITDLIPNNVRESEENNFSEALRFYTEGSAEFKKEFISLLIQNLQELQSEFKNSIKQNDDQSFRRAVHKITTSVKMLKDERFEKTVDRAKHLLETTEPNTNVPKSFIEEFDNEVKRMIGKLERS